jgi:hypothetical protein
MTAIQTEEKKEEVVAGAAVAVAAVGSNSNAQRRNEDFPDAFYCPLTEKIMVDPVVDTNGESFERSAVTARDKRDKVTGIIYYPNRALKTIIERELQRDENKGSLKSNKKHHKTSRKSSIGTHQSTPLTPQQQQCQQQQRRGSNQAHSNTATCVNATATSPPAIHNRKAAPVDAETLALDRHTKGKCHSCGQQLFTVSTSLSTQAAPDAHADRDNHTGTSPRPEGSETPHTSAKRGLRGRFSKHHHKATTNSSGTGTHTGSTTTTAPVSATFVTGVSRVPLSVPGKVHRGQCLVCTERPPTATTQTVSQTTTPEQERHVYEHEQQHPNSTIYIVTDNSSTIPSNDHNANYKRNNINSTNANNNNNTSTGTATYSGPFNDYGERHGDNGQMTWSNGDVYKGQFQHGHRHGHGVLHFNDGSEYVGAWALNIMDGAGTRRFPNGDVYMGDYVQGKRTGQGRFYFSNGDMYVGAWESDVMMGFGRYYYSSGQRFEGNFASGKRHGKGKLQRVDGELDIYRYEYDVRSVQGVRWSPDRTKAWLLQSGKVKSKLSVVDAVSLVYELENVLQGSVPYSPHASSTNGVQA